MPIKTITYLIYFFENLEDKYFEDLLKLIYGKSYFLNIYETSKELFLHILLQKVIPLNQGKISFREFTKEHGNIDDFEEDELNEEELADTSDDSKDKISRNVSIYGKIFYKLANQIDVFTPSHLRNKVAADVYNDDFLNIEESEDLLLKYINAIINSIDSFKIDLNTNKDSNINQKSFKEFINKSIEQIIKKKYFYTITVKGQRAYIKKTSIDSIKFDEPDINTETYIVKTRNDGLHISDENHLGDKRIQKYTVITNNDKANDPKQPHALIGGKCLKSYLNSNKYLDIAIAELNEQKKEKNCHICNPLIKNTTGNKKILCSTCHGICNLIELITNKNYKADEIAKLIKVKNENKLEHNEIREKHYKKLNKLIKEISSKYKDNYAKYETGLNKLIDKAFSDFVK